MTEKETHDRWVMVRDGEVVALRLADHPPGPGWENIGPPEARARDYEWHEPPEPERRMNLTTWLLIALVVDVALIALLLRMVFA